MTLSGVRDAPVSISQCTAFSGYGGQHCDTSLFNKLYVGELQYSKE